MPPHAAWATHAWLSAGSCVLHTPIRSGESVRISVILDLIADPAGGARLSLRDVMTLLGDRGFALFVVLLGLPNIIPMVPPIPLFCGLLIGMVSIQMIAGRPTPWLPKRLLDREMSRADARRVVDTIRPWVQRVERWCRPRLTFLSADSASRVIGIGLLVLSLGLLVAAPIVGQIPLGIAICLIGLGVVEKDGVVVLLGAAIGAVGISLSLGFAYAIIAGIGALLLGVGLL